MFGNSLTGINSFANLRCSVLHRSSQAFQFTTVCKLCLNLFFYSSTELSAELLD